VKKVLKGYFEENTWKASSRSRSMAGDRRGLLNGTPSYCVFETTETCSAWSERPHRDSENLVEERKTTRKGIGCKTSLLPKSRTADFSPLNATTARRNQPREDAALPSFPVTKIRQRNEKTEVKRQDGRRSFSAKKEGGWCEMRRVGQERSGGRHHPAVQKLACCDITKRELSSEGREKGELYQNRVTGRRKGLDPHSNE